MHPVTAQKLAAELIKDLHRQAAKRGLSRVAVRSRRSADLAGKKAGDPSSASTLAARAKALTEIPSQRDARW
jgi:hypothetical protein